MNRKKCSACGLPFNPRPQSPKQKYCSAPICQLERRRRWQQEKRKSDSDYRENDARYNKDWAAANPEYWSQYRAKNPEYVEDNRKQQHKRNKLNRQKLIANEDVSDSQPNVESGRYRIEPLSDDGVAKGDAWIVEITILSGFRKKI